MLDKVYNNHKHLILVYLVCISIILTLKFDKIGLLILTIFFLSMKYNIYFAFIGCVLLYMFNLKYKEGFTTTQKPLPNEIYYKFLNYFDLTDTKIKFNPIPKPLTTKSGKKKQNISDYWAILFSESELIDPKYNIDNTITKSTPTSKKLDEMLYNTLGRLFMIIDTPSTTSSTTPSPSTTGSTTGSTTSSPSTTPAIKLTIINVDYNKNFKFKRVKTKLRGTQFEYILKIVFLRNIIRNKVLNARPKNINFRSSSIIDSTIKDVTQISDVVKNAEFKTIDELNRQAQNILIDTNEVKHIELISNLSQQFSSNMISIIEDIINVINKDIQFSSIYDSYIYYIKNIFYILTEKGRLFYVGLFFMAISICLFFIETTK